MKHLLWLLLWIPATVFSADSGHVRAELVPEVSSVAPGQPFWVGLRLEMDEGWHTYWQNPGDSGAATELVWQLPPGFTASEIHWPYPERIPYGPLMNLGYHDSVMLLVKLTPPEQIAQERLTIAARGIWLVCEEICIPESANLSFDLPVGDGDIDASVKGLFSEARQHLPADLGAPASVSEAGDGLNLDVQMSGLSAGKISRVDYFPLNGAVIEFSSPQRLSFTDQGFRLNLQPGYDYTVESDMDGVVVVTEGEDGELQTAFTIEPNWTAANAAQEPLYKSVSLPTALLFAFLGGLILNLMPCVFPVLSIKVLSLVSSAGGDAGHVRRHGLVYMAGVVLSFVAIAAVLIALRFAGEQIGWGFQLQSPLVVGLLFYLFVLIGLNLSGYFEIGTSVMSIGQGMTDQQSVRGSFFTGVLATIVAAPCTAPFMGAAIGFALTQGWGVALMTFASLGLGMAIPYVLLCYSPALLARMPRPGPWMETFKELLAFPMYASALWLLWVLTQQTGADGILAVGTGLLAIVIAIWLFKRPYQGGKRLISATTAVILIAVGIGLAGLPSTLAPVPSVTSAEPVDKAPARVQVTDAEPYSRQALASAVQQGPVFVNFTAAWCITCKVNDIAVLSKASTRQLFKDNGVTYMLGDWTNEDPAITRALEEYGRSGVPLYLLYEQGNQKARVLPQVLTESIVRDAVFSLPQ